MGHSMETTRRIEEEEAVAAAAAAAALVLPDAPPAPPVTLVEDMPQPVLPDPATLPRRGEIVDYHLNGWRGGANVYPALVTRVHENGTADLVVIFDADDFMGQRRVPRCLDGSKGWERRDDAAMARLKKFMVEMYRALFGLAVKPELPILKMLDSLIARIDALEKVRGDKLVTKAPVKVERPPLPKAKRGK